MLLGDETLEPDSPIRPIQIADAGDKRRVSALGERIAGFWEAFPALKRSPHHQLKLNNTRKDAEASLLTSARND